MTALRSLLGLVLLTFAGSTLAVAASPSELVQSRSTVVLKALSERREEFRADPAALHDFVRAELRAIFDKEYSARLVLGRHSRTTDASQISAFAEALTENLLKRYGDALLDVDPGLEIRIKAETPLRDGKIVRVATEILRRAGAPVPVDYMFKQTAEGWLAFDVIVEGVSYVQTYRNQFDELLRHESIDVLTVKLASGAIRAGS